MTARIQPPKTSSSKRKTPQIRPSFPVDPTHDEIAARAYELFLERGGAHGHDLDDWLQAEEELSGVRKAS